MTVSIVKVGKRYTIVIPKAIREKIGLREGDIILVKAKEKTIILELLPKDPFKVLGEVIGEPYSEEKDEEKAEKWLLSHARS